YLKRLRYSELHPLRHDSPVLCVAFSPDTKYVATGTLYGDLRLWEAKNGHEFRRWPAHDESTSSVEFSPDRRYLASGGWDGKEKSWEMKKAFRGKATSPFCNGKL